MTGRVGYAFDNVLLYAKGGWGWANNKITTLGTFSDSQFHSGYTVGAGLEYMFVPNWSLKVEYMYADYSKENYFGGLIPTGIDYGFSTHTVKAGVNYHFNWGGPVVARY